MGFPFHWRALRRTGASEAVLVFAVLVTILCAPHGSEAGRVLRHMYRSFGTAAPSQFIAPEERRSVQEHWDSLKPSDRVVYLQLESVDGSSLSLPFVPASARHALPGPVIARSIVQSEPPQQGQTGILRSFASRALAVTVVGLSFMFVRDLFRIHKRRRQRKKAEQIEAQNLHRRMALVDRLRVIDKHIDRLETELDEAEQPARASEAATEYPDTEQRRLPPLDVPEAGYPHATGGDSSAAAGNGKEHDVGMRSSYTDTSFSFPGSATSSDAVSVPSSAFSGGDMEVSRERSSALPFPTEEQQPSKRPRSTGVGRSDGEVPSAAVAAVPISPVRGRGKILQSHIRSCTARLLQELIKIREDLHAAHGDALRLYVEGVMRRLKALQTRVADGYAGSRAHDRAALLRVQEARRYEEQLAQEDSEPWENPLPEERADDWAYRLEGLPPLGFDRMTGVFPSRVSLSTASPEATLPSLPGSAADQVTAFSAGRRVRRMERLLEKRPADPRRPVHRKLRKDEWSASMRAKRLYEVMKENPGLTPAEALARVKQMDGGS